MNNKCALRVCDCYHEDTSKCWHCTHNENPQEGDLTDNYMSPRNKVNELFKYLIDEEIPEGVLVNSRPKLSRNKAWNLIWFLQEVTQCLPSHIERCDKCGQLYDSDKEGYHLDDQYELNGKTLPRRYWGFYCNESCAPEVDFALS